jgi:hypothetical protein
MKARILIQHRLTSLYKGEGQDWTPDSSEALKFWDPAEGLLYCRRHHLSQVFLVMKFPDDRFDIKFALDGPNFFPLAEVEAKTIVENEHQEVSSLI